VSGDKLRCMPAPLGLLCDLDNRHHDRHGTTPGVPCALHNTALTAWYRVRSIVNRLKGNR
jgi:hypothetical protein